MGRSDMRQPPPSTLQWLIDSEMNGHSVEQSIKYMSDCADYGDLVAARRALPAEAMLVDAEQRWVTKLRSWLGR